MIGRLLTRWTAGKIRFQPFYEKALRHCLASLNYGSPEDVHQSGEINTIEYLKRRMGSESSPVIFDVGANVGDYARVCLQIIPDARVHCFEPCSQTFAKLKSNLAGLPGVILHNFGLGDKDETVPIYSDGGASQMASVFNRRLDYHGIHLQEAECIQLRPLARFCEENGIGRIHLLKLDVEGSEMRILGACRQMIESQSIDLIQFEFGGCQIDARVFFQDFFFLLHPGYRIHRIVKDGLYPIDEYREYLEIFMKSDFLAVSRKSAGA